eukprot:750701-Hanusia_phi.AAC.2
MEYLGTEETYLEGSQSAIEEKRESHLSSDKMWFFRNEALAFSLLARSNIETFSWFSRKPIKLSIQLAMVVRH